MILIRGADVLMPEGVRSADVLIENEKVIAVGPDLSAPDARIVEAKGQTLGPGFVDLHVHFREPGETAKEDFTSGAAAAVAGGYTAVVAMPNTKPVIDSAGVARIALEASSRCPIDIQLAGSLTVGLDGREMAAYDDLYDMGIRIFTDDGRSVGDAGLLRRSMTYLSDMAGAVVAQHAEDPDIAADGHMHEGELSRRLGIAGLASSAEEVILARDIILAVETGVAYHAQHLSSNGSVDLVRHARAAGARVTAEVTPHHLTLTDSDVAGLDTNHKMYPPLRTEADRRALVEGLLDGTIDAVATDHAPHTLPEKDVPFEEAPRGVIGLETSFSLTLAALGGDVEKVFDRMSVRPASIVGLNHQGRWVEPGSPANLVLVDTDRVWLAETFRSRSANSPFLGSKLTGKVMGTISGGRLVFEAKNEA